MSTGPLKAKGYDTFTSDKGSAQLLLEAQAGDVTKENSEEGATAGSAFVNTWNSILAGGSGMLALPSACQLCGLYIFPIVLILLMLLNIYTADLLAVGHCKSGTHDFQAFVGHALGPRWVVIMDVLLFLFCFGGCTSILEGAVDSALPLLQGSATLYMFVGAGIAASISLMMHNLDSLAPISTFSFFLILIFVCAMVWESGTALSHSSWSAPLPLWPSSFANLFNGTSIICFAWVFQYNVIPIFTELRAPQRQTWLWSMPPAVIVCGLWFLLCGVLPTLTYPSSSLSLFAMYAHSTFGKVVSFLFCINFIIMIPLVAWVGSIALLNLVTTFCGLYDTAKSSDTNSLPESGDPPRYLVQRAIVAFYALMVVAALCVPNLNMAISITSTMSGIPIMCVMPPLAFASVLLSPGEGESCHWVHSFRLACVATIVGLLLWACCIYILFTT